MSEATDRADKKTKAGSLDPFILPWVKPWRRLVKEAKRPLFWLLVGILLVSSLHLFLRLWTLAEFRQVRAEVSENSQMVSAWSQWLKAREKALESAASRDSRGKTQAQR